MNERTVTILVNKKELEEKLNTALLYGLDTVSEIKDWHYADGKPMIKIEESEGNNG